MGRRILAITAGYAAVVALTVATFAALFPGAWRGMREGRPPTPPGPAGLAALLLAGAVAAAVGGATAGAVGRGGARDGRALGAVMAVLGLASMAGSWGLQPFWYQVALVLIPFPMAALGGALVGPRPRAGDAGERPA